MPHSPRTNIAPLSLEELIKEAFHGHGTQAMLEALANLYQTEAELYADNPLGLGKQYGKLAGEFKRLAETCLQ